ncbi:MAG: PilZ domain-containing protein [Proteobacteria bacterium]|nr:PilZ domain-containing protein [Pseudomonadota bacterium]
MADAAEVLILDDGELDDLVSLLTDLGIPFTRLRGGEIEYGIETPCRMVVATPRRAGAFKPPDGPDGPTCIVAAEEDSNAMRRMLRRLGYDLIVRRPTHREVWRLLTQRALYQGDERRRESRVAVGSRVGVEVEANPSEAPRPVMLVDISNRGCRILARHDLLEGAPIRLDIPASAAGGEPLLLDGRVLRVSSDAQLDGRVSHNTAILFDPNLPEETRTRLATLLNSWTRGPESLVEEGGYAPLPACDVPSVPGLTLDEETDPAISANISVDVRMSRDHGAERRQHARGAFELPVGAAGQRRTWVLMGRDLSAGGMRVESLPGLEVGDSFELAIFAPTREEPFRLQAVVLRDDGELGVALGFQDTDAETAAELEKMVALLPDVESLRDGEIGSLGSVISEIVR